MKIKHHLPVWIFLTIFLAILPSRFLVHASTTDGTIDATYHYAWGENVGWVDFGSSAGNIHITDSAVVGSAYGENIGWVTFNPSQYGGVANNAEGALSGYAWSENTGWVDFSNVTISTSGVFAGSAYGENIGWITFGTGYNKVVTDWRPASTRIVAPVQIGGGGMIVGSGPTAPSAAGIYGYKTPRQQIINPDGRTVYTGDTLVVSKSRISTDPPFIFSQNRKLHDKGKDIQALQKFLNTHGHVIATYGAGSLNHETDYFGHKTQKALVEFQSANNIAPALGYFGPKTRKFINNLLQ